ncbi:MAG: hypothetical protein KF768_12255 [Phycisphaeraceae bacterium]|nr:hypothetical protein [Phycisphaeraceae bacterium]
MLRPLGLVLVLIGLAIAGWGIAGALGELVGLYSSAIEDPLAAPKTGAGVEGEEAVAKAMIDHVITGIMGVPFLLVGGLLMAFGRKRKRRLGI